MSASARVAALTPRNLDNGAALYVINIIGVTEVDVMDGAVNATDHSEHPSVKVTVTTDRNNASRDAAFVVSRIEYGFLTGDAAVAARSQFLIHRFDDVAAGRAR